LGLIFTQKQQNTCGCFIFCFLWNPCKSVHLSFSG